TFISRGLRGRCDQADRCGEHESHQSLNAHSVPSCWLKPRRSNRSTWSGWAMSLHHLAAQLREYFGDLVEQVVAIGSLEIVDVCAVPALMAIVGDRDVREFFDGMDLR